MAQTKIKAGLFEGIIGNGTDGYFLMSNGDGTMAWSSIIINPTISSIAYPGSVTAADPAGGETITVTGTGFKTGATVTIGGTAAPAVSYVSETQITFTTPAKAAGDYDIVVTNTDTGSATYINGISYNGIPSWTTAAGSLGTFASDTTISTITLQATEPDAGTITFNITNGALPTGLSLTGADIDGTTSLETADTLYTFTVTATDDESQATPRTFTITVKKQFINTDNFTINTYTGNGSTQSIEGKIGTAADFNGSSSYVRLPNNFINSNDFTVSLWINASALGAYDSLFGAYGATPGVNYGWVIYLDNGAVRFLSYSSNGDMNFAGSSTLSINTWYNVVLTYSASDCIIYINGVNDGNSVPPGNRVYTSPHPYVLGANDDNGTIVSYFPGKIDQVRVFNKALSSSEVTTLYGESNTSTTKSTTDIFDDGSGVALYEFKEGAKDTGGVTGYIGSGGIFNGSSSYIDLGSASSLVSTNFTFSAWVKTTSTSTNFIVGTNVNPYYSKIAVRSEGDGRVRCLYGNYTSNENWFYSNFNTINNGGWHHIVYFINQTTAKLYIDGSLDTTHTLTITPTTNGDLTLATYYSDNNNSYGSSTWDGTLDQVRIFNKELSSSEVTTLYGETSASATKSTTDIFSDGSGIALYELEGNANDTGGVTGRTSGTDAAVFTNADNSNFNLGNATVVNNSFGVSFWVKMNKISQSENVYLCSFMYGSNTSLYMDTNNVLQVSNGGYSRNESFSTTHTFAADTWYHIVYTGQIAGDSTLRCYVNGTQVGSRGWITGHNYTLTSGNTIGSYSNADNSIDGNIADFRIYKSTYLSASDVTALYSGTPPTTGLTEFYSFNGNDTDAQGNRTLTASNVIYNYSGTATNVSYAYDGTPTNVSFLGTSFQPDLVWIKGRTLAGSNPVIYDSIRGATKYILPNTTGAEGTISTGLTSFDTNGFTIGSEAGHNNNGDDFVAWCWKAASSDSTNNDGTITSTVRANQDAGFSIVKWTTTSAAAWNVGHGLSSAPEMIISKTSSFSNSWEVYHKDAGTGKYLILNSDAAVGTDAGAFSSVTNTTWTSYTTNTLATYIAYCFHSVDGYQKIGSYTGTGSAVTVTTGFQPRFVILKAATGTSGWVMIDSLRGDNYLQANTSSAESSSDITDFVSNGFTLKGGSMNGSGSTYIYLAIA